MLLALSTPQATRRHLSLITSSPPPPLLLPPLCGQSLSWVLLPGLSLGAGPLISLFYLPTELSLARQSLTLLQCGGDGDQGQSKPYLRRWCSQSPGDVLCLGQWQ